MAEFTTTNWFPVLTLLLGFGAKSLSDWVDHRRIVERDHAARGAARKEKNLERRIDFQHQTLLDLQEACMQLARSTSAMHHQDIMAFRNTGVWQKQLFGDDLSESARLANAKTMMLAARVRDEVTRELVSRFKGYCNEIGSTETQQASEHALVNSTQVFDEVNKRIGELLRSLEDAEN
jgi:hypothetical protein